MQDMTLVAGFWIMIAFNMSNLLYYFTKLKYISKDHYILEQRQVKTP